MFGEKAIPRLIIVTPLVTILILTALITYLYMDKLNSYFTVESQRFVDEFIIVEKSRSEDWVDKIIRLLTYNNALLEERVKKELKERVATAHERATYIYDRYRKTSKKGVIKKDIKEALERMVWQGKRNYLSITDYEGNNILSSDPELQKKNVAAYTDADGRAIVLEQIQAARKHGEAFLHSRSAISKKEQIIYVKDFGHYDWFFGSAIQTEEARELLKIQMYNILLNVPTDSSGFIAVFDKSGPLYISDGAKEYLDETVQERLHNTLSPGLKWHTFEKTHAMLHAKYFAPFGWYVLHGFDTKHIDEGIRRQQSLLAGEIQSQMRIILASSVILGLLAAALSLLFSRRINRIFDHYKEEVKSREASLKDFNAFLEERVRREVEARREKERMLIQQSKMAAMGDMLSMIAHQWRQPLNQMSYVLMNIEGAYEHDKLSPEYLKEKVKEGTELLEFMSYTIDDFRNFFRPDREREEVAIAEAVDQSAGLIAKSLEDHGIALESVHHSYSHIKLYRNELTQVLLNLIKNAKDAVLERRVSDPVITITTAEDETHAIITICDNGGGIDASAAAQIFEPYFTTKAPSSGTGLGLYMSRTIVEKHLHGTLTFHNEKEGACFTVRIAKNQVDPLSYGESANGV